MRIDLNPPEAELSGTTLLSHILHLFAKPKMKGQKVVDLAAHDDWERFFSGISRRKPCASDCSVAPAAVRVGAVVCVCVCTDVPHTTVVLRISAWKQSCRPQTDCRGGAKDREVEPPKRRIPVEQKPEAPGRRDHLPHPPPIAEELWGIFSPSCEEFFLLFVVKVFCTINARHLGLKAPNYSPLMDVGGSACRGTAACAPSPTLPFVARFCRALLLLLVGGLSAPPSVPRASQRYLARAPRPERRVTA